MKHCACIILSIISFMGLTNSLQAGCGHLNRSDEARLRISIFDYAGATTGDPQHHFAVFKGIIRDKISAILEKVQTNGPEYGYTRNIHLFPPLNQATQDTLVSYDDIQNYWRDSRSLELLRGIIFKEDSKYYVQSSTYIGDLKVRLTKNIISVGLPVHVESLPNTNDIHSLVTFYALAMDAARRQCDSFVISLFLQRTIAIINDIKRRGSVTPQITELGEVSEHTLRMLEPALLENE